MHYSETMPNPAEIYNSEITVEYKVYLHIKKEHRLIEVGEKEFGSSEM